MNIAILGAGTIAAKMAMTLQHLRGASCYAVAARELSRAELFANKYVFGRAYGSYSELLNDELVELVYIATPHSHHYEHIKLCLEHGKHVLVEKPFTATAAQAEEVIKMAEERGLFLAEAMWSRYMPMVDTILDMVNSGIIGKITSMRASVGFPMENKERLVRPELAGGALLDVGCYALHFASMIFGNDLEGIAATCTKLQTGVDAQEAITLTYTDGRMASLFSTMVAETDCRAMIYGTNGYIEVDNIINFEEVRAYNLEHKLIEAHAAPYQVTGYEYEVNSAMRSIADGYLECAELPHETILYMMRLYDNLRRAFGVIYPFELDPSISPVLLGEEMDQAKKQRASSVREISNTAGREEFREPDQTIAQMEPIESSMETTEAIRAEETVEAAEAIKAEEAADVATDHV